MDLFRTLSEKEVAEFKQSARDTYVPFSTISSVWHPEYCKECAIINLENHNNGKTKQLL